MSVGNDIAERIPLHEPSFPLYPLLPWMVHLFSMRMGLSLFHSSMTQMNHLAIEKNLELMRSPREEYHPPKPLRNFPTTNLTNEREGFYIALLIPARFFFLVFFHFCVALSR